jgi:uncharacterized damage-inducible protein DinB
MNTTSSNSLLAAYAVEKLRDHFAQARRCVGLLNDEQLWFRPNESSNSVANLLLHLRGNIGQWIAAGLGRQPLDRDRRAEFAQRTGLPRTSLLEPLREMLDQATSVIGRMDDAALAREYEIQEYRVTGVAAVAHVLEHFAFHTGQIVTTTKWLLNVDLSLYDENGHRRDGRNEGTP